MIIVLIRKVYPLSNLSGNYSIDHSSSGELNIEY